MRWLWGQVAAVAAERRLPTGRLFADAGVPEAAKLKRAVFTPSHISSNLRFAARRESVSPFIPPIVHAPPLRASITAASRISETERQFKSNRKPTSVPCPPPAAAT